MDLPVIKESIVLSTVFKDAQSTLSCGFFLKPSEGGKGCGDLTKKRGFCKTLGGF